MVKISYDENNAKDVKLIEDYFWFKYFCETLRSDWKRFYEENKNKKECHNIILAHINKFELKKARKILQLLGNFDFKIGNKILIYRIFLFEAEKNYKYELIRKFKDNK